MCHFKVVKYSGCGCELKLVMACCSQGDGAGNCSGASRYERVLQAGVCGRANCSYYEYQRPSGRWASGNSSTTPNIHIDFNNFGVHPKGPSPSPAAPKPTPEIPMPTSPKPYLYDMRELCNYSQGPYTSIDDNADYDFTLELE